VSWGSFFFGVAAGVAIMVPLGFWTWRSTEESLERCEADRDRWRADANEYMERVLDAQTEIDAAEAERGHE
jgi:hypothetical protein